MERSEKTDELFRTEQERIAFQVTWKACREGTKIDVLYAFIGLMRRIMHTDAYMDGMVESGVVLSRLEDMLVVLAERLRNG